jgi:hypothetical protein
MEKIRYLQTQGSSIDGVLQVLSTWQVKEKIGYLQTQGSSIDGELQVLSA